MGIDMKSLEQRALSGELKVSTATGGGGPKVGTGIYKVAFANAAVDKSQKGEKQLVLKLNVVEVVENRDEVECPSPEGGSFNWYFQLADDAQWQERLVADLVAIMGQLGQDKAKLFVDADDLIDIYINFAQALAKPIAKGTLGTILVERVRQTKNPKYFNHAIVQDGPVAPPKAAKETDGL